MWEYSANCDPENVEPCPYDNAHMVRRKRMQYHLMKCRKNHPNKDFATCPFNACHEMPRPELRYHIATCPDKAIIEKDLAFERESEVEGGLFKGCTDVPAYNTYEVNCGESWDDEANPHPRIGVDESFLDKVKFKNIVGMTPAEKRYFHRTLTPEHHVPEKPVPVPKVDKENQKPQGQQRDGRLRLPKNMPKAFSMYETGEPAPRPVQSSSAVFAYSLAQCGIGRGRGVGTSMGPISKPGIQSPRSNVHSMQKPVSLIAPNNYPIPVSSAGDAFGLNVTQNKVTHNHQMPVNSYSEQRFSEEASVNFNQSASTDQHPYETIPPSASQTSQASIWTAMPNVLRIPDGIFPEQTRTKPVGRGGGSIQAFLPGNGNVWPALGETNVELSSKSVFKPSLGRGVPFTNGSPAFITPKVQPSGLKKLSQDWYDSEGSGSSSGTETSLRELDSAKKKKQLQKKLRQIESLEAKMKTGTPLNTEEEIKLSKKEELVEELEALSI